MSIETGVAVVQVATEKVEASSNALLAYQDTPKVSRVFHVGSTPVRLVAFGLTEGNILVKRVILSTGPTELTKCGDLVVKGPLFEKHFTENCVPVMLCVKQDEIVIRSKGYYLIEYVGDAREKLHVVHIFDNEHPETLGLGDCCENTA